MLRFDELDLQALPSSILNCGANERRRHTQQAARKFHQCVRDLFLRVTVGTARKGA